MQKRVLPQREALLTKERRGILYVFVLSLAIRLAWLLAYPRVVENEGAQYLRLAENLFDHRLYAAMRGPVTMISPLYSIFIGTGMYLTGSPELAARLISLVAGAILPILFLLVAFRIYGRSTAYVAGILATLHPLLIALSGAIYSEGLYLNLLMAALYAVILVLEGGGVRSALLAGVFCGLAYLARPEGLLYAVVFACWIVAAGRLTHSTVSGLAKRYASLLALSIALSLPFMIFLTLKIGRFYWEGKSPINDNLQLRMKNGMGQSEANAGLGSGIREDGPALQDDQFVYAHSHPVPAREKLDLVLEGWGTRSLDLLRDLQLAKYFGSPVIWILAAAGLLGGQWNRKRWAHEILLCTMMALLLFILGSMHFVWDRFLFPLVPFLVIWSAHGAVVLYQAGEKILERRFSLLGRGLVRASALLLPVTAVLLVLAISARDVVGLGEFTESRTTELKSAGTWIASHKKGEKTVMTIGMVVPYYAGATARTLPYSDSRSAIAYIHTKNPDFIVLRAAERAQRPYLSEWLRNGIPDPCASQEYRNVDSSGDEIVVYRWNCRAGSATTNSG